MKIYNVAKPTFCCPTHRFYSLPAQGLPLLLTFPVSTVTTSVEFFRYWVISTLRKYLSTYFIEGVRSSDYDTSTNLYFRSSDYGTSTIFLSVLIFI